MTPKVHPSDRHVKPHLSHYKAGTRRAYESGCRCAECQAFNTRRKARNRARNRELAAA